MTSGGSGSSGGDEPPRSELPDDPLQHPASEAGWDGAPGPPAPIAEPASGAPPAGTVEAAPSVMGPSFPAYAPPDPTSASSISTTPIPTSATSPDPASEEPLLPATYDENDLRSAIGASPLSEPLAAATRERRLPAIDHRHDGGDGDGPPRNRKAIVISALGITAGLAALALVFVGRANSDRLVLACETERAVPQQGRGFPPWGTRALGGQAWKPLKIAPETRCQPHETDDPLDLERFYLAMILDQATALLTAREVTKLDDADALLEQALLLTRPPEHEPEKLASERNEHHKEIERMLGDVTYWRATARLHDAQAALADAAKQFDSAAAQHPRHVSDASAWATYARKLAQELHAGPTGAAPSISPAVSSAVPPAGSPAASPTEHPNVPAGVALPVEPGQGTADEPAAAPPPPDAGPATGGVLL